VTLQTPLALYLFPRVDLGVYCRRDAGFQPGGFEIRVNKRLIEERRHEVHRRERVREREREN